MDGMKCGMFRNNSYLVKKSNVLKRDLESIIGEEFGISLSGVLWKWFCLDLRIVDWLVIGLIKEDSCWMEEMIFVDFGDLG